MTGQTGLPNFQRVDMHTVSTFSKRRLGIPLVFCAPSPRHRELLGMSTLESQFPVTFPNGTTWQKLDGNCAQCGGVLHPSMVHGLVSRPIPSVAVVEAVGECEACKKLTQFYCRLHDDMRITGPAGPSESSWCTWAPKRSLLKRIWIRLRQLGSN
jgi:hypothetical protein